MMELVSVVFFLAIAFNTYIVAKRQGRWSWPQFFIVVAALIVIPILVVAVVLHVAWLQDKPGIATAITTGVILLFVGVLAYIMNKFLPKPKKTVP